MDRPELAALTERALANANESALALVEFAESLEGERKFVVQQIAWAIQEELEAISSCLKQQAESESSSEPAADQANVVRLSDQKPRSSKSEPAAPSSSAPPGSGLILDID
jgi:hypothetical protein